MSTSEGTERGRAAILLGAFGLGALIFHADALFRAAGGQAAGGGSLAALVATLVIVPSLLAIGVGHSEGGAAGRAGRLVGATTLASFAGAALSAASAPTTEGRMTALIVAGVIAGVVGVAELLLSMRPSG